VAERGGKATGVPTSVLQGISFALVAAKRNRAFSVRQCTQHDDQPPVISRRCVRPGIGPRIAQVHTEMALLMVTWAPRRCPASVVS
jgi:hypothetical protein